MWFGFECIRLDIGGDKVVLPDGSIRLASEHAQDQKPSVSLIPSENGEYHISMSFESHSIPSFDREGQHVQYVDFFFLASIAWEF